MSNKVESLELKLELVGSGLVNFDSSDQKFFLTANNLSKKLGIVNSLNNNIKLAKKNFFYNIDGDVDYKNKISSNCLRNALYKDFLAFRSPEMLSDQNLVEELQSSIPYFIFGDLKKKKDNEKEGKPYILNFKRKSPFYLTDATENSGSKSHMEFMSTTGERGENSIHNVERIGDTSYTAKGLLDFKELQFVSCDDKYDRCAINESLFNENGLDDNAVPLKDKIKENIPSFSQEEIGSYRLVNGIGYNSERGFLFSNEDMLNMTKWLFRQISKLSINNATGFARINKLSYRFIYENSSFLEGDINKSEWINVNSQDDIESINFDIKDNYAKIY